MIFSERLPFQWLEAHCGLSDLRKFFGVPIVQSECCSNRDIGGEIDIPLLYSQSVALDIFHCDRFLHLVFIAVKILNRHFPNLCGQFAEQSEL